MRTLMLSIMLTLAACKRDEAKDAELAELKTKLAACESAKPSFSAVTTPAQPSLQRQDAEEEEDLKKIIAVHEQVADALQPAAIPLLVRKASSPESQAITVGHLDKNVQPYMGKPWKFTGEVLALVERNGRTEALIGHISKDELVFSVGWYKSEFVRGDVVEVVGFIAGTHRYESQPGQSFRVPVLLTAAMVKPGELRKLAAAR